MIANLLFSPMRAASPVGGDDYASTFARVFAMAGRRTTSGQCVNPMRAMQLSAVYTCVTLLSRVMGSLRLSVVDRSDGKRITVDDHPVARLLRRPNPEMTAYDFQSLIITHMGLRGNFFAEKVYNGLGEVIELWPIHPDLVTIERREGVLAYIVQQDAGPPEPLRPDEVIHIKWHSDDGIIGTCPIDQSSENIGHGLAIQEFGTRHFLNDGTPPIAIEVAVAPKDKDQADLFLESWTTRGVGEKRHRAALLPPQSKLHQLSITNEQAQWMESMQFSDRRIASMYGVASVYLNDPDKDTYASGNAKERDLKTYTLGPVATNIEQELDSKLLDGTPLNVVTGFETLLRGDPKTRAEIRMIDIQSGVISPNEARQDEGRNPVDGLDYYNNTKQAETIVPGDQSDAPDAKDVRGIVRAVARDAIGRVVAKECRQLRARVKKAQDVDAHALFSRSVMDDTRKTLEAALAPTMVVASELGLDLSSREFADRFAVRSRAQVDAVSKKAGPDGARDAVIACVGEWESSRADEETEELLGYVL